MNKRRQGFSNREYARHAGVSAPYVQKLVAAGKIPCLPDGSIDARVADAARAQRTRVGKGQRRRRRLQGITELPTASSAVCSGCGETFSVATARAYGSPDASKFCSKECCNDVAAGLSRATIRRRIFAEAYD
jgi:hypothetical protein